MTVEQAKSWCHIDASDDDATIENLIKEARAYVENYTGLRLVEQTIAAKCDAFADLSRLPFGPVISITSIGYVDVDGADQTLATSVYETRIDGLNASILLKYGQAWPSIRPGSRITVTAVVGYATIPEDIMGHMRKWIATGNENREFVVVRHAVNALPPGFGPDAMLANYRLGA